MGNESRCRVRVDGDEFDAKVLFETEEIIIRGEKRVTIPLREIASSSASSGTLKIAWSDHTAAIDLGEPMAAKWLEKIRNPKSRLDKIGIKAGQRVSVIGVDDPALADELRARGADVSTKLRANSDVIFFGASDANDLARLAMVKSSLAADGALWIIRPKGVKTITEAQTMAAGKSAGLVDVKVVKFSDSHTAEKFVIPVAKRSR